MTTYLKSLALAALAATTLAACDVGTATNGTVNENKIVDIQNNTDRGIFMFYARGTNETMWGDDMLGSNILLSGKSERLDFSDGRIGCLFDMKAEYSDGTELVKSGVNVCTTSTVSFP